MPGNRKDATSQSTPRFSDCRAAVAGNQRPHAMKVRSNDDVQAMAGKLLTIAQENGPRLSARCSLSQFSLTAPASL